MAASVSMHKLKSKLSTRNQFTGRAMTRMAADRVQELLQTYMSWEQTCVQRRFHTKHFFQHSQAQRHQTHSTTHSHSHSHSYSHSHQSLHDEAKDETESQQRFQQFAQRHNGEKPLLILDVDNTMVYVRVFSEEMQIGDIVTYFATDNVRRNNGKIIAIQLTLSLEIADNTLIDRVGSERMEYVYWTTDNQLLEVIKYKAKNAVFDYEWDEKKQQSVACKICEVEVTACKVQIKHEDDASDNDEDEDIDMIDTKEVIEIDFINENDKLSKLEPMLDRRGMRAVDFIYEGFLVRLRPNLDEFLEEVCEDFDVVIFTSANKQIYEGLLKVLHEFIKDQLGRDDEDELRLWTDVLYRDDCTLDYNEKGKPYHHKDLTLFGCDLSRVIMLDNSPIVCRGEEPNFILIKDYFGKDDMDDELMEVYQQILEKIVEIQGDVRYFLCGLESDQSQPNELCSEQCCLQLTQRFLHALREHADAAQSDTDDNQVSDRDHSCSQSQSSHQAHHEHEEENNEEEEEEEVIIMEETDESDDEEDQDSAEWMDEDDSKDEVEILVHSDRYKQPCKHPPRAPQPTQQQQRQPEKHRLVGKRRASPSPHPVARENESYFPLHHILLFSLLCLVFLI